MSLRSASSTMRQSHEFAVICRVPLRIEPARKTQKFCATAHSRQGSTQAVMSNHAVVARRPSRSVMMPPASPKNTWETIPMLAMRPIWASCTPRASMKTDMYGSTSAIERPHSGSVHTQARGLPRSVISVCQSRLGVRATGGIQPYEERARPRFLGRARRGRLAAQKTSSLSNFSASR